MKGVGGVSNATTSSSPSTSGKAQSLLRILREHREIEKEPNPYWYANPLNPDEPYEWHFTIRGPAETEFTGGVYHGRIVLPQSYPFTPPSVMMLTQNGRFEVGKKVCLSATNYHPELWQPAWGLRTMLDALHAFFPTPGEGALHSLDWPPDVRRKIAKESIDWCCPICKQTNLVLVESKCSKPTSGRPVLPESIKSITARSSSFSSSSSSSAVLVVESTTPASSTEEIIRQEFEKAFGEDDHPLTGGEMPPPLSPHSSSPFLDQPALISSTVPSQVSDIPPATAEKPTTESNEDEVAASSVGGALSVTASSVVVSSRRQRPHSASRSLLRQLIKRPESKLETMICLVDLGMCLLVGAIVVLMVDLILKPPQLLYNTTS